MKRQDFNLTIAREVMGWETALDESSYNDTGYTYTEAGDVILGRDFTRDHNAAALVRERVAELERIPDFVNALSAIVGSTWYLAESGYTDVWDLLSATPEQTARAAYRAVTGKELEVVDE